MSRRTLLLLALPLALWCQQKDPAFAPIADTPGLPRVLIIGDSISIGYTLPVRELLRGVANVHRIPENAAFTRFGLTKLDAWLGTGRWDIIHVNFGLHDLKIMEGGVRQVPVEEYERNLDAIFARLKTGATVIFANTTPVPEGKVNPLRDPADVPKYNAAAARAASRAGVPVTDLFAAVSPHLATYQRPVNVHFVDAGSRFLAETVVAGLRPLLAPAK
ncbi:MAG: SGNH/GDSL hydrolase family protein [Bryobacterales bacterium]|nr:SGNH/GDSL hydrolase family protein [Bryobacterales bacterium]